METCVLLSVSHSSFPALCEKSWEKWYHTWYLGTLGVFGYLNTKQSPGSSMLTVSFLPLWFKDKASLWSEGKSLKKKKKGFSSLGNFDPLPLEQSLVLFLFLSSLTTELAACLLCVGACIAFLHTAFAVLPTTTSQVCSARVLPVQLHLLLPL